MGKFVVELLKEIDNNPELMAQYVTNNALVTTLQYAFDPALKMRLPEGEPPFKPDSMPLGMNPANFQQETRRFNIFCRPDEMLNRLRRETLFVQLIEGLHPDEAKVMIHVKDQNLTKLYPNITLDLMKKHGVVAQEVTPLAAPKSEPAPVEDVASGSKRGRGRPPGARNKAKSAE